jgi:hypothetical protein
VLLRLCEAVKFALHLLFNRTTPLRLCEGLFETAALFAHAKPVSRSYELGERVFGLALRAAQPIYASQHYCSRRGKAAPALSNSVRRSLTTKRWSNTNIPCPCGGN